MIRTIRCGQCHYYHRIRLDQVRSLILRRPRWRAVAEMAILPTALFWKDDEVVGTFRTELEAEAAGNAWLDNAINPPCAPFSRYVEHKEAWRR